MATFLLADSERGFLITGTAMGRVSAWPIPHLIPLSVVDPSAAASAPTAAASAASSSSKASSSDHQEAEERVRVAVEDCDFWCIPLAKGSDEGIRSIFLFEKAYASLSFFKVSLVFFESSILVTFNISGFIV